MKDHPIERVYKSIWHALIALVGVYELRNHKTTMSKVLATGLIAFHIDAAIADAYDVPTISQKALCRLLKEEIMPINPKTRNGAVLLEFVNYCIQHPDLRFWQALLNWSGVPFMIVGNRPAFDIREYPGDPTLKLEDPYPWEGRNEFYS